MVRVRRSKLDELFAKRQACYQGIAGSMPSGVMGQDFAVQYIKARAYQAACWHRLSMLTSPP